MRGLPILLALALGACTFDPAGSPGAPPDPEQPDPNEDDPDSPLDDPEPPPPEPPAPDPDPELGCQEQWIELLVNPDFDDGKVEWSESGLFSIITDDPPIEPHSPDFVAWLGGYPMAKESLWQRIEVPEDALALRFGAKLSARASSFSSGGRLVVELRGDSDAVREALVDVTAHDLDQSWEPFELDLDDAHPGESLRLVFRSHGGMTGVSFLVDTVSVAALVCD
jgi:hypothetical protein